MLDLLFYLRDYMECLKILVNLQQDSHITNMIIVDVNSEDLLVIKPRNLKEMGDIAHQLGNLRGLITNKSSELTSTIIILVSS
jgi:urease accessory protein UreE